MTILVSISALKSTGTSRLSIFCSVTYILQCDQQTLQLANYAKKMEVLYLVWRGVELNRARCSTQGLILITGIVSLVQLVQCPFLNELYRTKTIYIMHSSYVYLQLQIFSFQNWLRPVMQVVVNSKVPRLFFA